MPFRPAILITALFAGPLAAQDVTGTWACQSSVQLANGQGGQALDFAMTLFPNGQFQVQGISFVAGATHDASGQFQFTAQGSWTIAQGASGPELLAQGQIDLPGRFRIALGREVDPSDGRGVVRGPDTRR